MTKRIELATRRFCAAILLTLAAAVAVFPQFSAVAADETLPAPTGHVNDFAGVIDAATKAQLETKLRAFKEKTGVELAVAVVKTTGSRPIFEYSLNVARTWGIGAKSGDNPGALLFVAIDDRKYFTQVSRNLEDELPDGVAGNLQRQFLVPQFKKANYAQGISDTLDAYMYTIEQRLSGGPAPDQTEGTEQADFPYFSLFCCLAVILVIILIIWSNRNGGSGKTRNDQDRWGGGFGSGGGVLPWIVLGGSGSSSSSSDWGSSGGSDWGGFGGGGDFGGGGAGGDW